MKIRIALHLQLALFLPEAVAKQGHSPVAGTASASAITTRAIIICENRAAFVSERLPWVVPTSRRSVSLPEHLWPWKG